MHTETRRDLLCLSHLRWGFVYQRPQHLMTRFARDRRVLFLEEPVLDSDLPHAVVTVIDGVHVIVPHVQRAATVSQQQSEVRRLLSGVMTRLDVEMPLAWFYTPMALPLIEGLPVSGIVYDCMDELSSFAHAPVALREREQRLLARADVVFTGGRSLFEAKQHLHPYVRVFPSSVDVAHFAQASGSPSPADQQGVPGPRIGFCGVIDERMDLPLLAAAAAMRPDWHFVMIGPTAKVDPAALPAAPNIHYLGMKRYQDLPAYFGGWQVAIMPFARNEATRYISPTKTPEYLAAGCPVVSTSIRDVVTPYGDEGLVFIADTADAFVAAIEQALTPAGRVSVRRAQPRLSTMSWDWT